MDPTPSPPARSPDARSPWAVPAPSVPPEPDTAGLAPGRARTSEPGSEPESTSGSTSASSPTAESSTVSAAGATASGSSDGSIRRRVSWRSVIFFVAIAYGLFALVAAPFWVLEGGITHPLYSLVIGVGMFAPTIASVVVAKFVDRTSWRDAVGLRFRGTWGRILLWAPLGLLLMLAINAATAVLMVLRGVPGDLTGRTWAAEVSRSMAADGADLSTAAAVGIVVVATLIGTLLSVVPALGEEIGWRGWLWRELKPLGTWPAIVLGGTIWSLWHLPVTLIGHNYTGESRWAAVAMFIPACIALNYLFVAITQRAGGNPIPSAFAHATLNSTLGLCVGVVSTSETADGLNFFLDLPTGLVGILIVAAVGFLAMPRHRRGELDTLRTGHGARGTARDA